MAKPWSEVANSDGFKALPPEQQDGARQQYFNEVVAPKVPTEHRDLAWQQFTADVSPAPASVATAPTPVISASERSKRITEMNAATDPTSPDYMPEKAKASVLEGVKMPEPAYNEAELIRQSRRDYAERPLPGDPRFNAPSMTAGPAPTPKTIMTERGEALQDSSLPVRAGFKAMSGIAQGAGGVMRAAGDFTGSETLKAAGRATSAGANEFEQGMGQTNSVEGFGPKSPVPYLANMAEGAASSLGQTAAFASLLGPRAVIPLMSIQTAGQEYNQARDLGLSPSEALAGAIPKGIFEAVGEKFTGLDKAAAAMGTLLQKGASDAAKRHAGEVLIHTGIKEIPGEVITYLGQTGVDLLPGIGLNPDLTMSQFIDGLRDTVVQAGMMGAAMGGGGSLAKKQEDPRIQRLRDAGETAAADLLQKRLDQQNHAATVASELDSLPIEAAKSPEFQDHYRQIRAEGVKPAEAAGRTAVITDFRAVAAAGGMSDKAIAAAMEAAKKVDLEKLPGFLNRYTQSLAAKGAVHPMDVGADLEAARDHALNAAIDAIYKPEEPPAASPESAQAVDNIERLIAPPQKLAQPEQSQPVSNAMVIGADDIGNVTQGLSASEQGNGSLNIPGDLSQSGSSNAAPGKTNGQGSIFDPKDIGDYLGAYATSGKSFGALDIPSQRRVFDSVLSAIQDNEVFGRVVQSIPVSVVNDLAGSEWAAKHILHNKAMFIDALRSTPSLDIRGRTVDALVGGLARSATEVGGPDSMTSLALKNDSAMVASKSDVHASNSASRVMKVQPDLGALKEPLGDIQTQTQSPGEGQAGPADQAPSAGATVATGTTGAVQPAATADLQPAADQHPAVALYGRNGVDLNEGGKAFKTKLAADEARKLQPGMRVVRTEGGFALAEKTQAQIDAQEKAAKRLRNPQTSPRGEPIPAHAFIAGEGGLSPFERADMGMEGNVKIGNRSLFAADGKGLTIEKATEKLIQDGYLPQGASHAQARTLIRKSLTKPQYTAAGFEQISEKDAQARFEATQLESDAVENIESLSDNQIQAIDDSDIPWDAPVSNTSEAEAMRAMGFTEQEIENAITSKSGVPGPDSQGGQGTDASSATPTQGAVGQGKGPPGPDTGGRSDTRRQTTEVTKTPSTEGVSASGFSTELRPSGTLAIRGNTTAILAKLTAAGITKHTPMDGGVMVGKTQAQKALDVMQDKPAPAPEPKVLSVGMMLNTAEPVTVKNGVVYIAKAEPDTSVSDLIEKARQTIKDELGQKALDEMGKGSMMHSDELTQALHDGHYAAIRDYAASMPVPVHESDIPRDVATRAHSGTSYSPEARGDSARRGYVRSLVDAWKQAERAAKGDPEALARVTEVMRDVVDGYRSRYLAALGASSRVMSSMIAGPAKFPVASNQKKSETADRRAQEADEFLTKGIAKMQRAARGPIDNSPDSELVRVRANLEGREAEQSRMKAINTAHAKFMSNPASLEKSDLSEQDKTLIREYKPKYSWEPHPFAPYELTNNNANIRRLRDSLAEAEKRIGEAAAGPVETTHNGVRIEENAQDDRLRLFFDGKPSEEVRTDLKNNGFKWSPNSGAWQRQLTDNARATAKRLLEKHFPAAGQGTAMFSRTDKPIWRSALKDGIDGINAKAQGQEGWRAQIQGLVNKGTVKADEVEWSGVTDFLKMQTGKVTKEQVQQFLDGNGVKVTETVLSNNGDSSGKNERRAELQAMSLQELRDEAESFGVDHTVGNRADIVDAIMAEQSSGENDGAGNPTKYSQYTLPGGSHYREVLLTLPEKARDTSGYTAELVSGPDDMGLGEWQVLNGDRFVGNPITSYTMENAIQTAANRENREKPTGYKSSHWDQSNVLAHIRLNDRTDADGRKIMFIEELQSDFGQSFKKQKDAINKAVDNDFEGIIERMKKSGILEVECD